MHREKRLWKTSTLGEAFPFVQALSCCSCLSAAGNTLRKSEGSSLSFTGNKNPHSWVVPAWALPFWPSWLSARIWVPVISHVFTCKLLTWPTTPSGLSRLCQEQPFHRRLSKAQQNIRICMSACFLLHPYQAVSKFTIINNTHHSVDVFMSSEEIRCSCVSARDIPKMLDIRQLVKETK